MSDIIRLTFRDIQKRRGRSAAVIAGYAVATAGVILLLTANRITNQTIAAGMDDMGAHTMAFIPRAADATNADNKTAIRFDLNNAPSVFIPDSAVETIRCSPVIADASPYLLISVPSGDGLTRWIIGGFDPSRPKAFSATMAAESQTIAGEFLKPGSTGIMIEKEFADAHQLTAGSQLTIASRAFNIAAVVKPPLRPGKANIYMGIGELRSFIQSAYDIDVGSASNSVLAESKGALYHQEALAAIRAVLGDKTHITSFGCSVPGATAIRIHDRLYELLAAIIAAAFIALILKSQIAGTIRRRRDIAVLRSVGWRLQDILLWITSGALIDGLGGGVIGSIAGLLAIRVPPLRAAFGIIEPGSLSIITILIAFAAVIIVSAGAGVGSAIIATRVRPSVILRRP